MADEATVSELDTPILPPLKGLYDPPMSLGDKVENASIGLGEGFAKQLEDAYQMIRHPVDYAKSVGKAAAAAYDDPKGVASRVGSTLADMKNRATSGPLGLGEVVGENLSPRAMVPKGALLREMVGYHGTPHTFEPHPENPLGKFDINKVGSGEGLQAYGHGIYVAENPKVARQYHEGLSRDAVVDKSTGKHLDIGKSKVAQLVASVIRNPGAGEYAEGFFRHEIDKNEYIDNKALANEFREALEKYKRGDYELKKPGGVYHVDIPDEHVDKMLDWDKSLKDQSPEIKKGLEKHMREVAMGHHFGYSVNEIRDMSAKKKKELMAKVPEGAVKRTFGENPLGGTVYLKIADFEGEHGAKQTSGKLHSSGIPGIKYFDGTSRRYGEAAENLIKKHGSVEAARKFAGAQAKAAADMYGLGSANHRGWDSILKQLGQKPTRNLVLFHPDMGKIIKKE